MPLPQNELIIEQTFFCAIYPIRLRDYIAKVASLLAKEKKWAELLFDRTFEDTDPPDGTSVKYKAIFEPSFQIQTLGPYYNNVSL